MIATATVQFYDVVVFFHVLAVVIGFGPTFAYAAFITTARREGGQAIPAVGRTIAFWDRTVNTIAMTVILLSGIYLASDGPYGMGSFFVSWGFVAIIFLFAITHAYFIPKTRQSVELAERDLGAAGGRLWGSSTASTPRSRRSARWPGS